MLPTLLLICAVHSVVSKDSLELANTIVDWVREKGGFFSDKLEIRHIDPRDSTSPLGVFAREDIDEFESLLNVPHACYIGLWDEALDGERTGEEEIDGEPDNHYDNVCNLSRKLANELKLGNESEYAPYLNYVRIQREGQLPATWSEVGKDLLRSIEPSGYLVDWMDLDYHDNEKCIRSTYDRHMLALTVQRGYDTTFIPLWDMINHRNGHVNTESDPMYDNGELRVRASTKIPKGQEIYASYDECDECQDASRYFGTPEILSEFGFVEQYRQRWVVNSQRLWWQLDFNDDGDLVVEWDTAEDGYGIPGKDGVDFLKRELSRLQKLDLKERPVNLPVHEYDTILQYHQAFVIAVSKAVESAEAHLEEDE